MVNSASNRKYFDTTLVSITSGDSLVSSGIDYWVIGSRPSLMGVNFSKSSSVNVSKILFPKLKAHMLTRATSLLSAINSKSIVILPRLV